MTHSEQYANEMAEAVAKELVGGQITEVFVTPEDEYDPAGFGFIVTIKGKRKIVCVQMDPEGNGPGFLDIQEATEHYDTHKSGGQS